MSKWKAIVTEHTKVNQQSWELGSFNTSRLAAGAAVVYAEQAVDRLKRDGVLCYSLGDEQQPNRPVVVKSRTTQRPIITVNVVPA